MKTRNTILAFGIALMVSFGVFYANKNPLKVNATDLTDLGTFTFTEANSDSTAANIYGINWVENKAPGEPDWSTEAFHPVNENSGTFVNGDRVGQEIKKLGPYTYYIAITGTQVGTVATVKGQWANSTYSFTVNPFTVKWNGTKWENYAELEPYDKVTLSDACIDDYDKVAFDHTVLTPSCWNTFVTSEENTTNSFSFEFYYETYSKVDTNLFIRVGTSGAYETGHHYRIDLNNTWGPKGVILFYEYNNGGQVYKTKDLECDLAPGKRHKIEFGSVYIKDSTDTFNFVNHDGIQIYGERRTPASHDRTTKVSCAYAQNNLFFGSTPTTPKQNTQILKYSFISENKKGIYLDGVVNDIPAGWEIKGAPASKYNALYNGEPLFTYGNSYPMAKPSADERNSYYLDLSAGNVTLKEGDVITLSGDYHFYANNKAYSMGVVPISMLVGKNQTMTQIENIYTYLYNKIATNNDLAYYDDDKVLLINQIVEEAETALPAISNMKALWDAYHAYIEELDAIPFNEEKAREILNNAKEDAKAELNALLDPNKYIEANLEIVQGYVSDAIGQIELETTDTVKKVQEIVIEAKELIAKVKTKQQSIEEMILEPGDELPVEYLEDYEVVTTTDLCAVGDLVFLDTVDKSYHSGGFDDTTARIATSSENPKGNMIFQFTYESDDPSARGTYQSGAKAGAQIHIRMRGPNAMNAYRFDIAVPIDGESDIGVALSTLKSDIAVNRIVYNAKLVADTQYKIECGAIDLDNYNRTLLFMRIDGKMVIKTIVDVIDEVQPTICIMDSIVATNHMAKMSPIEEGTTKADNANLIGRLILDESSDKDTLLVTLRDNDIEVGSILYPVEKEAFKLNGEEISAARPTTKLQKTGQNKYVVAIDEYEFKDGDEVTIGGHFAGFVTSTVTKNIYRLFETTFTYHEASNSWSQVTPTDPDVIVYEAQETIKNYVNLSDYSETNAQAIKNIIDEYVEQIGAASVEQVPSILEEGLKRIDAISTLLDDYKTNAKEELNNYRSKDLYRDEEKASLEKILSDAYQLIDNCNDYTSIDLAVQEAKGQINELKTAAQRDVEDLADAKKDAGISVQAYSSLIQMERYSDENADNITNMTYKVLEDIEKATSIDEVNTLVSTYKENVKNVKTKDGSTFDGEKYIEKAKGCGGSIVAASALSFVALFSAAILVILKKLKGER